MHFERLSASKFSLYYNGRVFFSVESDFADLVYFNICAYNTNNIDVSSFLKWLHSFDFLSYVYYFYSSSLYRWGYTNDKQYKPSL